MALEEAVHNIDQPSDAADNTLNNNSSSHLSSRVTQEFKGGAEGPRFVSESSMEENGRSSSRGTTSSDLLAGGGDALVPSVLGKRKHTFFENNYTGAAADDESSPTTEAGLKLLFVASLLQQKSPSSSNNNAATATNTIPQQQESQQDTTAEAIVVVKDPNATDVLCGRGGFINKHPGNLVYRRVVEYNKSVYKQVPKRHRILVSQSIVQTLVNQGSRFLQYQNGIWTTISVRRAVQKTSQALREKSETNNTKDATATASNCGTSSSAAAVSAYS